VVVGIGSSDYLICSDDKSWIEVNSDLETKYLALIKIKKAIAGTDIKS